MDKKSNHCSNLISDYGVEHNRELVYSVWVKYIKTLLRAYK